MAGTPYPKVPMHRFAYTKLTKQQISDKLEPVAKAGPASASPLSGALAGKTIRIVTDKGPTLAYKFTGNNKLSVAENDAKPVQAGYAALTLDRILLVSHLLPGSQRGFTLVIDQESGLATVFELWFSGYEDNREVQREFYMGYVDRAGQEAPKARHVTTNRFEGKGYYWKQDAGPETLEYYPTAAYSHFVELTRPVGEYGYSAPSDYIQIDDDYYIYTRTEAEFSGTFTLYVVDVNRIEQIGIRLGFDQNDKLEYYAFRGTGEWIGQIAQFEKFGDIKGEPIPRGPAKGQRRIYRPLKTMPKMTKAQVDAAVAKSTLVFQARTGAGSGASGMAVNGQPSTAKLAGRNFTLRYDGGPVIEYRVSAPETLSWRFAGSDGWAQARYRAWEPVPGVFIFGHLLEGQPNHDGHMIVADFDEGLVTAFHGYLNTPYYANEAGAKTIFGVIEADGINPPERRRHEFTDELLGRAITWNYAPNLTSMHLYSTPNTVSWIIFTDTGAGGMEWSGPGEFVKIRDQLYFAYWLEEACNGTLGTILVNLRTMHDSGIGYHCGTEGLSMSQVGAHGRHAGKFEVTKYFQAKTRRTQA